MRVEEIRAQFPALALTDDGRRRIYFDNPAGTQVADSVVERMRDCMLHANANVGGEFSTSQMADRIVAESRATVRDFLNAESSDEIIFGQNMTGLTFHLARSIGRALSPGDEIVLSRMEHDANVQPWRLLARDLGLEIRWLEFSRDTFEFEVDALDGLLNERTRLLCIGAASNLTGTINPVAELCRRAREAGAWTFVDAVQAAPHVVTDVQAIGCDFLACSAYKFFGPHQGVLWGQREVLESLEPYKVRPAPDSLPGCFEPGTQSHEGMAGTAASIDYIASLAQPADSAATRRERIVAAFDDIVEYEMRLSDRLISGLEALQGVSVQGVTGRDRLERRVPTVSFTHDRVMPDDIAAALAERGVFVWSGHNYAIEPARFLGLLDAGGVVRVGPVHYNTEAEIDELLEALEAILG